MTGGPAETTRLRRAARLPRWLWAHWPAWSERVKYAAAVTGVTAGIAFAVWMIVVQAFATDPPGPVGPPHSYSNYGGPLDGPTVTVTRTVRVTGPAVTVVPHPRPAP